MYVNLLEQGLFLDVSLIYGASGVSSMDVSKFLRYKFTT